jgi:glucose/arabinose dehydrogenase
MLAALAVGATVLAACGSSSTSDGRTDGANNAPKTSAPQTGATGADASSTTTGTGGATKVAAVTAITVAESTILITRPGDAEHLYLGERAGRVRRLKIEDGGKKLTNDGGVLLDIAKDTTTDVERGLLGLAFSRDGKTIYVSHTDIKGNSRVLSYAMTGTGQQVGIDAASAKVLLTQDQPRPNHNGGNIAIGPDGKLWLGLGDGGPGDDPDNRAQNPETILGKMIRLDPSGGRPEIMVSGVRNPWRWSFDTDGSLWIGDVGQNKWEEVDHLPADKIKGANLGWSGYEGNHAYLDGKGRRPANPTPPVFDYSHDDGNCSITGGFVYRGKALAGLDGAYLFADYCAGRLRAITVGPDGKFGRELDLGVMLDAPVSFTADAQGEPYVLSDNGAISRLVPGS